MKQENRDKLKQAFLFTDELLGLCECVFQMEQFKNFMIFTTSPPFFFFSFF